MTKEEILKDKVTYFQCSEEGEVVFAVEKEDVLEVMDTYAKQEAVDFFKWNCLKVTGYLQYIEKVKPLVTSKEIEDALNTFEGATLEERYELYLQSKGMVV